MNKLQAYVKRTIVAAAKDTYRDSGFAGTQHKNEREFAKAEALKSAFMDATRGVDTGWWSDLIYTRDVYRMADRNRKAIAEAIQAFRDETATTELNQNIDAVDVLSACVLAPVFQRWSNMLDLREDYHTLGEALMFVLKFAVEWYAQELASEMGVEL